MLHLRDYQQHDLEALRVVLRSKQAVLYVAPCGSGKGTVISHIVNTCVERKKASTFAVHGKTLVHDMSQRVARLGIKHGVLLGGHRREHWHAVQVASIDTLWRMNHPPKVDLFLIDEAHMCLSPTWSKAVQSLIANNPAMKIIGFTATPIRLDKKGLGRLSGGLFDDMVLGPSEQDLINMGHLVKSRTLEPTPPTDLGKVGKVAGEFNTKQMAQVCDKTTVIGDIVKHWKRHAHDKKTAAFGVDQAHANHIAEQFREAGVNWAYVDAETPDSERARIWRDLDDPSGNLMGVSSVGCISVGWDHPIVSCLIAARKTASLGLWKQMLGRGSRPYRGKDHFLVLDHVGNRALHHPYGYFEDAVPWQLNGPAIKDTGDKPPSVSTCKKSYRWPDFRNEPPKIINGLQMPCYATFKTGPRECPYCGLPLQVDKRTVTVVEGELKEIVKGVVVQPHEQEMRAYFDQQKEISERRGYKQGWLSLTFRARFNRWPPKGWIGSRTETPPTTAGDYI